MPAEYLEIHPKNPDVRKIAKVVSALREGAVIVYPTDTVYGMGCDIMNARAIERIAKIKGIKPEKNTFSFICNDISHISVYAKPIPTEVFKLMKRTLPGAYTYILEASTKVPKLLNIQKKNVGIRIPDNNIARMLVNELGNPIVSTSVHDADRLIDYTTDPSEIYDNFKHLVDFVIDGGYGQNVPSTVIDCTSGVPELVRQGLGETDSIFG
jgi:tRNA threonylcarbamoyl adenosine modification protein (Sua5/YciO/YrdC/YwlC family)